MNGWLGQKRWLLAAVCALGAVALLAAALMGKEETGEGKWVPMNEAMALILADTEEQDGVISERLSGGGNENAGDGGGETAIGKEAEAGAEEVEGKAGTTDSETKAAEGDAGGGAETKGDDNDNDIATGEDGKIDINRASAEQLDGLKGIGPAKAQAIVADREKNGNFGSVDDLLRVKGIGDKLLSAMKESVVALP